MEKRMLRMAGSLTAASLVLTALLLLISGQGLADTPEPAAPVAGDAGAVAPGWFADASRTSSAGQNEERAGCRAPRPLRTCASAAQTTVTVSITETGFDPQAITIPVGSTVVWTNHLSEAVQLVQETTHHVFLPLVMRGPSGRTAARAAWLGKSNATTTQQPAQGWVWLDPGESHSHTFTSVDIFQYRAGVQLEWTGEVRVEPLKTDEPGLMWAVGDEGVLLRWRWPQLDPNTGQPAEQPLGYNIYRDGERLNTDPITRVTDATDAERILDSDWDWIRDTYTLTTIAELHDVLDKNPLLEHWLADQRYRVALVRGLGYLDRGVLPGDPATHTYRVEAELSGRPQDVGTGTLSIRNTGATPLERPNIVTVTTAVSDELRISPDWAEAQKNRKGHARLFLKWALPQQSGAGLTPDAWVTSYEIYRAGPVSRSDNPATMDYERITQEPVAPMADRDPMPPPSVDPDDRYTVPYDHHDYYFADQDLEPCAAYAYRVAPLDLLGQAVQTSTYLITYAPDALPPAPPAILTPTTNTTTGQILISWEPVTDAVHYQIYRSEVLTAAWPGLADCTSTHCWTMMDEMDPPATQWTDTGGALDQRYWYVVRAVDAPCPGQQPNLSAPSRAVTAILHDRTPPPAPDGHIDEEEVIVIDTYSDTAEALLYCKFDDESDTVTERMLIESFPISPTQQRLSFNLAEYYTPVTFVEARCALQALDAHSNRSPLHYLPSVELCPADDYTLTRPVITDIGTQAVADGWAAHVAWEVDDDQPHLAGFKVQRYRTGVTTPSLVGESVLGPDVRDVVDEGVVPGPIYSYTVSAIGTPGCGYEFGPEIASAPRLYKVVPPLGKCTRPTSDITWDTVAFHPHGKAPLVPEGGTELVWEDPHLNLLSEPLMRAVVYRSLRRDGDYVAITPPFETDAFEYGDTDAEHGDYWYVVVMLDFATGEILARTSPRSPNGGATPDDATGNRGRTVDLPRRRSLSAPSVRPSTPDARPEEIDISASMDTYVSNATPGENFGNEDILKVEYSSDGLETHGLVRFALSALPAGAVIDGAGFYAYNLDDYAYFDGTIELRRITEAWDEMDTVWEDRPALAGPLVTTTVGTSSGWAAWEVTSLVEAWHQGTQPNHGVAMVAAGGMGQVVRAFASREDGRAPYLHIAYTPLPDTLTFGTADDNPFVVTQVSYEPGSTPTCMTGQGTIALGGVAAGTTYERSVTFSCITADTESGVVSAGTADVALAAPLAVSYAGGFDYQVASLTLSWDTAWGDVELTLPEGILFHYQGTPYDPLPLTDAVLHQDLSFAAERTWINDCYGPPPTHYFEMDPLPLRVVPTGDVLFFQDHVNLFSACTQYVDRYNGTRPEFPAVDANDGYLRPVYNAASNVIIDKDGLNTALRTEEPVSYATAMPYGFELEATGVITVDIWHSRINHGAMHDVDLRLDYYQRPEEHTLATAGEPAPVTTAVFTGHASSLVIGAGGSLFGTASHIGYNARRGGVRWASDDGFVLHEPEYFLYLPPIQTAADRLPSEEASADWSGWSKVQAGLNQITEPPPDSVDFTWYHCEADTEITFPKGVTTDLYLRRGGVSDQVTATIPLSDLLGISLYHYTTVLDSFRLSFCDNYIHDSDVSGDVELPFPTEEIVRVEDMQIDPDTACVDGGRTPAETLNLSYWDVDLHPRAVEFRKRDWQPSDPEDWTRALWILGTMEVPHLSPPGEVDPGPIPMETSFKYDGTIVENRLVHNKVNYGLDGFAFLLSEVELSSYETLQQPDWDTAATLAEPPELTGGFVELAGNTLEPVFGTLKGRDTDEPPDVYVLGWDPYVGFSEQPSAKRTWDVLVAEITWGFDLVYAQHWDVSKPRGTFLGFRTDDLVVVQSDMALILSSWVAPERTTADLLLGLSAGNGVLRALAETTVPSTSLPAHLGGSTLAQTMTNDWVGTFGLDTDYVDFLTQMWDQYAEDEASYAETTDVIDAWADAQADDDESIPNHPAGGGTTNVLEWMLDFTDWDVQLKKMRGHVEWEADGTTGDFHFEECRFSLWFKIKRQEDEDPLVLAERLSFFITRDGDFVLEGNDVKTNIYDLPEIKADFIVDIRTQVPSVETSLAIQDLEAGGVVVDEMAATVGVGLNMFYLGALLDNAHPTYADDWRLGGAILLGVLNPSSRVLTSTGFLQILEDIGATGETDKDGRLGGGYLRVYGEFPVYDKGCLLRISAGGEIAAWYFAAFDYEDGACDRYGGRLRGYIYGDLLCVVGARGDLTLEIYRNPPPAGQGCGEPSMRGQFWAAGGIGFCDPKSWTSWETRWWGDGWCWTAGAVVGLSYDGNTDEWDWHYDADYE